MGKTYGSYREDIVCRSQSIPDGKDTIESLTSPMKDNWKDVSFIHYEVFQCITITPRASEQRPRPVPKARGY